MSLSCSVKRPNPISMGVPNIIDILRNLYHFIRHQSDDDEPELSLFCVCCAVADSPSAPVVKGVEGSGSVDSVGDFFFFFDFVFLGVQNVR